MKIRHRISLSCLVVSTVIGVSATKVNAAHTPPHKVFAFESIKGLGSCKSELSIRAEHRDTNGVTLWLSVKGASSTTCSLTLKQDKSRFEHYSLSGMNFSTAHRFQKQVPLTSNSVVIPKPFMTAGRVITVRLSFFKPENQLVSPLLSSRGESGRCASLVRQIRSVEMEVRRCFKDTDCSSETIPFGCGCHYEKPLRRGARADSFHTAVALATQSGCSIEEVTMCECREVSDVICRMGVCDWK